MTSNVSDILGAITAANEALMREPSLKSQIYALENDLNVSRSTVQERELSIIEYKRQIDELQSKNRSLEVERDQAQFRTLELEEQTHMVLGNLINFESQAKAVRLLIDPPKPEPTPEPIAPVAQGQGESPLFVQEQPNVSGSNVESSGAQPTENAFQPTTMSTSPSSTAVDTPTPTADPIGFSNLTEADVKPQPYKDKQWSKVEDRPYSLAAWIDGGGSQEGWNS